ncbi:NADH:flavin oxidoreductase/NADH oxidase family protein [Henriciella aquimarina]|uniref:NADH:flavin oxidoreductase/NADH oxidase family protein n=1 Tax=Henriciella aquimarina TaxID=545261 RepID=UPI000A0065B9|nr:NADH:flavin oxidoreductase/NADH oxidase family protein [Henriciella aquimarina]
MTSILQQPLGLPCGQTIPNRLCKAAMTEQIAVGNRAGEGHATLYSAWAGSGCGLLLTGNVLVDPYCLESPGNVVIAGPQPPEHLAALKAWSAAAKAEGAKVWMQISHAGRQTPKLVNPEPLSASDVQLNLPGGQFGKPRAMTEQEIHQTIQRFAECAAVAKETGFDGVQVHGAHGYLISQFLSPRSNRRSDEWGGSLENRARLLLEIVHAVRAAVGSDFPVGVKLNSADFQQGGFSFEECCQVVDWLNDKAIDLLEISGGNYEQPKLLGIEGLQAAEDQPVRESTKAREAYFVDYAAMVRERAAMPVMATGGFRSKVAMEETLSAGYADMIGLGAPLCTDPHGPAKLLAGEIDRLENHARTMRLGPGFLGPQSGIGMVKMVNALGQMAWNYLAIEAMSEGRDRPWKTGLLSAYSKHASRQKRQAKALDSLRSEG